MVTDLAYWLAILYLKDVGWRTLLKWLQVIPTVADIFTASAATLQLAGLSDKQIKMIKKINWHPIEQELKWADNKDQHIISLDSPDYPLQLKEIAYPPLVLYVQGNKQALMNDQLAIVGARSATATGMMIAEQMAATLAKTGLTITSGMALGIDRAAHEGALTVQGKTIGVAGTGLHYVYPASNKKLINDLLANRGAIVSEFTLSTPPKAMNFPRRNRIISGLSKGVLVIEAAIKSGSLITAKHALEQGKEIFAVPGSIHQPLAKGCHYLIQQGAKLVETAEDIVSELGLFHSWPMPVCDNIKSEPVLNLSEEEQAVFKWINYEMTPLDVIILRSGLTTGKVSSILLRLELYGHIQTVVGGYVRASKRGLHSHV